MKRFFYLEVYDSLADYHCRRKSTSVEQPMLPGSHLLPERDYRWFIINHGVLIPPSALETSVTAEVDDILEALKLEPDNSSVSISPPSLGPVESARYSNQFTKASL
ncbi:uncharacterized protein RSE6_05978 [Rhynchosporium secalis]|uniref:Uncharacterized protein n=1 Tax=Rhynchosporium secalis TaxID=38038 RepID=A0A1E1M979_RHYSE|nr:uncharacterized protein RSE6_05978 [Rhynchosporium secalis]